MKNDWSLQEIQEIYELPFPTLLHRAHEVHRANFSPLEIQRSTLLSIKTGGCPEDCGYCPQSAHHESAVKREALLPLQAVLDRAQEAKESGSTRFCMGAAWREVRDGLEFEKLLQIVRSVSSLGLEVCCTLGMLTKTQAEKLKEAGCFAYNHNLDTSPEYYGRIITTRTYQDRLKTIDYVRNAGMTVCCGGIVGMGESRRDRVGLLHQLSSLDPHPESVPVNMLVRVEGTPLADTPAFDPIEFVRVVATARIIMPKSMVRLSAGRTEMSEELQALCFFAGANSIFAGEKLLTTPNCREEEDVRLLNKLGMHFIAEPPCIKTNLTRPESEAAAEA